MRSLISSCRVHLAVLLSVTGSVLGCSADTDSVGSDGSGGATISAGGGSASGAGGSNQGGASGAATVSGGTAGANGGNSASGNGNGNGGASTTGGSGVGGSIASASNGGAATNGSGGNQPGQGGTASGGAAGGSANKGGQAGAATGGTATGGANGGTASGGTAMGGASSDENSVIRVQVNYDVTSKQYKFGFAVRERSGTAALQRRAKKIDPLGSFIATVLEPNSQTVVYQQTIGIGYYYRELTRALSFRFPARTTPFVFRMTAENATSGVQEEVVKVTVDPSTLSDVPLKTVETQLVKQALMSPKIVMPFYAEGYLAARKDAFFKDAKTVSDTLSAANFPGVEHFEIVAVWTPSNRTLGDPGQAGVVPNQDTALGVSFPVWSGISGPELIVYPTDESKLRNGFAQVPYDYPVVIVDDSRYWGVGNYNMYTAVPARSQSLNLLIVHEMGHFFGLNEEYGGQETELAFASNIAEPWSQNITFRTQRSEIKWGDLIETSVAIPTPASVWNSGRKIGAYRGGYPNDSRSMIPVPDGVCIMSSGPDFCAVCRRAILAKATFDSE